VCVCVLFVCACSEINRAVKTGVNETESCGGVARADTGTILVVCGRALEPSVSRILFATDNCFELQWIRRRSVVIG
jgi:hypothetical protein